MNKVFVLVGPTAVGKTELSIEIAQRFQGEIISGDSIQVYRGLNIGSGKITFEQTQGIVHRQIDILDPKQRYSVAHFQTSAREAIQEITMAGKLPMIVGGTGLYVKATLYDYQFLDQPEIDEALLQSYEAQDKDELYQQLCTIDSESAKLIHPNNKKRVIRALLIHSMSDETKSAQEQKQNHEMIYDAMIVGCGREREILSQRIQQRVDEMLLEGLEEEVRQLLKQGVTFDDQSMQGIGYKEWKPYFQQEATLEQVRQSIKTHTRQFSRRQMTWFTNQTPIEWIDLGKSEEKDKLMNRIERWLEEAS